jgi:hypothetical protein
MGVAERKKPGPKPGQRHSGQFQPGYDEKRHVGSPWEVKKRDFGQMCKEYTPGALEKLNQIIEDESASNRDRLSAIELMVSHAVGTPVNRSVALSLDGGLNGADVAGADNNSLLSLQARLHEQEVISEQ